MELGNMLSLMLLVTKIVLTTIRPGQNNPNLCIHWLRHKDSNTNKTNPKHTSVHPLSGGVVNASSFPARGTATAWHSTQHSQHTAYSTEHTAHSTHAQPQPDPGVDQTLRHMPATCHACPAFQFQLNFRQKKYKQTKHKSIATTSCRQLASYSSILCINALNCSNWFFFLHFNWVSTGSTTNNHCNGLLSHTDRVPA